MRPRTCPTVLALALLVGASIGSPSFAQENEKPFQGSYEVVKAERNGQEAADVLGHRLTVKSESFEIKAGDKLLFQGTFRIDRSNPNLWKIDITHDLGELKGKKWLGIMRVEPDGSIEICDNATDPSRPRPETFKTAPGSGAILLYFKKK